MTIRNSVNNVYFNRVRVSKFTSSTTYNKPANLRAVMVVCTGGGGGSGGCAAAGLGQSASSGHGGGGGICIRTYSAADLPNSVTITVGAGGNAGPAGANAGGAGQPTTFLGMTAQGGQGSAGGAAVSGGYIADAAAGGGATGGDVNIACPTASPQGIAVYSGVLGWQDSQIAIPGTGDGSGGAGQRGANGASASAGNAGFRGSVFLYEYFRASPPF